MIGRPPKTVADKQDQLIMLRLTRREKIAIFRAAKQAKIPAATFVRQLVLVTINAPPRLASQ